MTAMMGDKRILVIDQQPYWRTLATDTLSRSGYLVTSLSSYDQARTEAASLDPDLVILSCSEIGGDEHKLITDLLQDHHNLIIFVTSLSQQVMRKLFIAGARDVTNRTVEGSHFADVVQQVLRRHSCRDSYERVKEEGIR
ncbi:MAG: response regulator [Caldilineaceae bacterium]|nr:response regulator [Caldilineaceae bacterium]